MKLLSHNEKHRYPLEMLSKQSEQKWGISSKYIISVKLEYLAEYKHFLR